MNRIHVVLHRPIYSRNVGMCARAMANMGVGRLIVIAPQGELTDEAKQGAAHAQTTLRGATIYPDHASFLKSEGEGLRIALSGKDARLKSPDVLTDVIASFAEEKSHLFHQSDMPIYLMFGPEDDGLSSEEMELCHHVCRLPTFGEITSLNLSHAVLLTTYIVRSALGSSFVNAPTQSSVPGPAYYPSETIHRWLAALGFDLSAKRISIEKTLNRIFLSRCPSREELRILDSVLQQTVRKLSAKRSPGNSEHV